MRILWPLLAISWMTSLLDETKELDGICVGLAYANSKHSSIERKSESGYKQSGVNQLSNHRLFQVLSFITLSNKQKSIRNCEASINAQIFIDQDIPRTNS